MVQVKRNADWNLLIEAKLAFFFVKVTILIFFGKIILRESDRKFPCFVKYRNRPIEAVQERTVPQTLMLHFEHLFFIILLRFSHCLTPGNGKNLKSELLDIY